MSIPLLHSLKSALAAVQGEHTSRFYNDALNYKGPRSVENDEAAVMIANACAGFVLDWRRPAPEAWPEENVHVLIAFKSDEHKGIVEGYHEHGVWYDAAGLHLEATVYAWAPVPPAPAPELLSDTAPARR